MGRPGRKPIDDEFTRFGRWLVENGKATERAAPIVAQKARGIYRRLGRPLDQVTEEEVRALFVHYRGKARANFLRAFRLYREYIEALRGVA